ncbi:MAG: hypothetical protein RXR03_06610 [Thermocladium sp.]
MGLNPYSSFNEIINAMKLVLTDRRLIALFLFSIPLIFLLYYYLFTSTALGYLYLGRLYIIYSVTASLIFSVLLSASLVMDIYAAIIRRRIRGNLGSLAATVVATTLPAACCSPLLPSLVALVGGSYLAITMTGKIQGLIGLYDPILIGIAVILSLVSLYLSARSVQGRCESCKR